MKRWNITLMSILMAICLLTTASAHGHPALDGEPIVATMSPWAQEEVQRAQELGFVPELETGSLWPEDYRKPITRDQFTDIALQFVAMQNHCDLQNWGRLFIFYSEEKDEYGNLKAIFIDGGEKHTMAYLLGIIKGREDGHFDPDGLITRQEAAVMLTRAYESYGGSLPKEEADEVFPDQEAIAPWAQESAAALMSWKVLQGMPDGSFSPEGQLSVEQCILTFLRLYENTPISRKNGTVTPYFSYEESMAYLDARNEKALREEFGFHETLRIEGAMATVLRSELRGASRTSSDLVFVYHDGGIQKVDLGICNGHVDLDANMELQNPRFSEDGKTFYCTATISEETVTTYFGVGPKGMLHEEGIYHITIDVDTCRYSFQREDLPA